MSHAEQRRLAHDLGARNAAPASWPLHRLRCHESQLWAEAVGEPPAPVPPGSEAAECRLHPDLAGADFDRTGRGRRRPKGRTCSRSPAQIARDANGSSGCHPARCPGRAGSPCAGSGCRGRRPARPRGSEGPARAGRAERSVPWPQARRGCRPGQNPGAERPCPNLISRGAPFAPMPARARAPYHRARRRSSGQDRLGSERRAFSKGDLRDRGPTERKP